MLGVDGKYPARSAVKSAVKHSMGKSILLSFVNLPAAVCPRLHTGAINPILHGGG